MRRRALALVATYALSLTACAEWTEIEDVECPPEGTDLSYESFGRGFMLRYCNDCHGAGATERKGAPQTVMFDTYEQTFVMRERVFLRSAGDNVTMPPGPDDPPQLERDDLALWIACGAPE